MSDGNHIPSPQGKPELLYRYEAVTPDGRTIHGWFPDEATARLVLERAAGAN